MKYLPLQGQVIFCLSWSGIAQLLKILQNTLLGSEEQVVLVMGRNGQLCRALQQAWNVAIKDTSESPLIPGCRWVYSSALPSGAQASFVILSSKLNLWLSLSVPSPEAEIRLPSVSTTANPSLLTTTFILDEQTIASLLQHPLMTIVNPEFSGEFFGDRWRTCPQTLQQVWLQLLSLLSEASLSSEAQSVASPFDQQLTPISLQQDSCASEIAPPLSISNTPYEATQREPQPISTTYFRWFLETSSDIYAEFDCTLKYQFVNAAGAQFFGLPTTEIIGKTNQELLGDVADSIETVIRQTFEQGEKIVVNHEIRGASGYRIFETLYTLMGEPGSQIQHVMSISRDITELKQRWQLLEAQNRELTENSRLKQEFIATTSHELRTPLTAILGFSNILLQEFFGELNLKQKDYLERIHNSGRHLLELINDILDLSRIEADRLEMELELVSISDLCENVVSVMRERSSSQGLMLEVELAENLEHMVADPRRLKQMLFNLLSNAIKFTPTGSVGLKVYRTRNDQIDSTPSSSPTCETSPDSPALPPNEQIHFLVWDTGIGINETDQKRLFRPFAQIDSPLARKHQGTGLGLVITRKLAELHGGSILLKSQLGRGSHFILSLPLHRSIQVLQKASPQVLTQNGVSN
ncbi:MAG: PAS domain-containing sensor histidine kinase [Scytolyngbya sp. HA4215-MV1]|jgi:PAS domain S-box-containing protein|nr:PAS domain-containing sensor histidine kinase [Scytolyngbya sp. HA4215-MV1]